jgi:1-acyl-sn-glycerol-3-phosphate acyltransferase
MQIAVAILAVLILLIIWRVRRSGKGFQAWFLYQVARSYTHVMFDLKAEGVRNIPRDSAALVVSNHTSPVDPMLTWADHRRSYPGSYIRLPGYMMAREYYDMGGIPGWIFRVMQSIPVERDGRDMRPARSALERLKAGNLVSIFPEGRINDSSPDTQLLPGDTGAAWLALKSKVPVIPLYIRNAPRGPTMAKSFLSRSHSTLVYGKPIDLSEWYGQRVTQALLVEVTRTIMKHLADLGGIEAAPRGAVLYGQTVFVESASDPDDNSLPPSES